ncbi:hypothetical protein [Methylobacter sp.]|uniref:hypothetical protein n=1 Tax=Methylobacter sp. TaxID=2051955 RepID=UPI0024880DEA|nr:hypothetical protein [Methylobacter sp.]MDI1278633.1 hypothetical protein [Methylobacter sp.]MDI1359453.1 hypothetical protein [Methylobacter sp.]
MSEICPNCGADSFTDHRTDQGQITCYNCGEDFDELPSEDGMFVHEPEWQEENLKRQQLNRDYESLDDGEEDPDLDDDDLED